MKKGRTIKKSATQGNLLLVDLVAIYMKPGKLKKKSKSPTKLKPGKKKKKKQIRLKEKKTPPIPSEETTLKAVKIIQKAWKKAKQREL